ncbi:MAG: hypothetical protein ACOX52_06420 [Verrucomicrobiota bacterium]|jgi:hypothetical protein
MEPTHPDRLVENVTAPSAGGFPGPDGEVRLRMRLPFRMASSQDENATAPLRLCAIPPVPDGENAEHAKRRNREKGAAAIARITGRRLGASAPLPRINKINPQD